PYLSRKLSRPNCWLSWPSDLTQTGSNTQALSAPPRTRAKLDRRPNGRSFCFPAASVAAEYRWKGFIKTYEYCSQFISTVKGKMSMAPYEKWEFCSENLELALHTPGRLAHHQLRGDFAV